MVFIVAEMLNEGKPKRDCFDIKELEGTCSRTKDHKNTKVWETCGKQMWKKYSRKRTKQVESQRKFTEVEDMNYELFTAYIQRYRKHNVCITIIKCVIVYDTSVC